MSTSGPGGPGGPGGSGGPGGPGGPGDAASEEELRAAYEAEIKRIRVENLVLEQVITLVNMGMRRTGLAPGTEDERDVDQVRVAIESIRALMPVVEPLAGPQAGAIRDALSQLQLAYVRIGGAPAAPAGAGAPGGGGRGGGAPGGGGGTGGGGTGGGGSAGGGAPEGGPGPGGEPPLRPGEAGPAQRSGRLWVPGQ